MSGLLVIPSLDILGDYAVRLQQGDFRRVTSRSPDPVALLRRFAAAHPPLIHVVDLDGARSGRTRPELIARLVRAAGDIRLQVSGGIRSPADAAALLQMGAGRVVIGTDAFDQPGALARYVSMFGERLVVAVDAYQDKVAVHGWERRTDLSVEDALEHCAAVGVRRLLCTSIERDGTLAGPDFALLERVRSNWSLPLLAAGGISREAELRRLAELGFEGAIVGRAFLDGTLPLSVAHYGRSVAEKAP